MDTNEFDFSEDTRARLDRMGFDLSDPETADLITGIVADGVRYARQKFSETMQQNERGRSMATKYQNENELEQLSDDDLREAMAGIDPNSADFRRILGEETEKQDGEVRARAWREYQGELRKEFEAALAASGVKASDILNYHRVKAPFAARGLDRPMPQSGLAVTDEAAEAYSRRAVMNAANRVKRQKEEDTQAELRRQYERELAPHRGDVTMIFQIRAKYQARGLKV